MNNEALQENENQLKCLFENAADSIFIAEMNTGIILDANRAAELLLKMPREKIIGKHQSSLHPENNKNYTKKTFQKHQHELVQSNLSSPVENAVVASDGSVIPVEILASCVTYKGRPCIMGTFRNITERKLAEEELKQSEERAKRQRLAIARLATVNNISDNDLTSAFNTFTRSLAETIQVERAGIWLLNEDATVLKNMSLYQTSVQKHSSGTILKAADYPAYFEALIKESRIYAHDALTDPRTTAFKNDYLIPLDIASMLDAGIHADNRLTGVICLEHTGFIRKWKTDEEAFVSNVAALLSQIITNQNRKQAERALSESEEKYRNLFTTMPNGFYRSTPDGYFIDANPAFVNMLGYDSLEDLKSVHIPTALYVHASEREEILSDNPEFEKQYEFYRLKRKDGQVIWIQDSARYIKNAEGTVIFHEGICQDITERRVAEIELLRAKELAEENSAKVTAVIENTTDNIWAFDTEYRIVYINKLFQGEFHQTFGVWLEPGVNLLDSLPGPIRPLWKSRYDRVLGNEQFTFEDAIEAGDSTIYIQVSMNPIVRKGKVIGGSCFGSDITERKLAEANIIYQSKMQEILTHIASKYINIPLQEVNPSIDESLKEIGRFVKVDRVYVFDYLWDKNICRNTHEWCAEGIEPQIEKLQDVRLEMIPAWAEKHRLGETIYIEDVLTLPQDDLRSLLESQDIRSLITIPMMKEKTCVGFIGFDSIKKRHPYSEGERLLLSVFAQMLVNIYTRKSLEEDLLKAKERAVESDRLKSAFLANMSHEIRTPMNGILGFTHLLKVPNLLHEKQTEYISIIEKSGERLLNIINDIIDISKIEAGMISVNITDKGINEQLEIVYSILKLEAGSKGIRLTCINSLPPGKDTLRTDHEKLYAVLLNLVKNAIKYTDKGKVEFGYNKKANGRYHSIEFYVKDTGIGIPENRQLSIFDRFVQADIEDSQARQGAGLGLSISKAYVEKLGGKIWVESTVGYGSTFYFTLPYHPGVVSNKANRTEVNSPRDISLALKIKLLVAEDDENSGILIDIAMSDITREVLKASNGIEAVEMMRSNPDTDLVIMDIRMPLLDGYEATRQIRKFNPSVVIIAQTAYALSGDREKAIEAGCNDYIAKPVKKNELFALIQKYF